MCSKSDSDSTYCSEVEELIKATSKRRKSSKNVPVRRSERLSQKLNVSQPFSWNNMHITRTGKVFKTGCILCPSQRTQDYAKIETAKVNKCTQDIFSIQDLREDQEILHPEFYCNQYNISLNNNLTCNSKSVKLIKAKKDVPLDLSNKSKVSMRKTSQMELDIYNAANDMEYCKVKNNIEEANHNIKAKIKRGRKPGRPKQIPKKSTIDHLKPKETDIKLAQPFTTIQLIAEDNSKDLENHSNMNFNSLMLPDIQHKTSKVTHSKRKPCNKTINSNKNSNIEQSKIISVKCVKNITSMDSKPSELILKSKRKPRKARKASNKTINLAVKSDVIVTTTKEISDVQQKSSINTNSNIETNKPLISLPNSASMVSQSSELISNSIKRTFNSLILPDIQLKTSKVNQSKRKSRNASNTTINSVVKSDVKNSSNNTNSNIEPCNKPAISQKIKSLEMLESKAEVNISKIPNYQDIFENTLNETNSIKISQKMPINEKRKYTTVELQDFTQHIKSEPFTSSWDIYTKSFDEQKPIKTIQTSLNNSNSNTNSTENINTMEILTNKLHNKASQIKSGTFTPLNNYQISCGKVESQSPTAANKNNQNLKENTEIKKDISDNLKSKVNPLKSSYETQQIKTSQKLRLTRNSQKLSIQHTQNADTETNELQNQFQYGKANLKSSNETKKPKTVNSSERNKKLDTNIKTKVTKNYLKSYDKTLFLDKIQSSKSYSQTLLTQDCNYDKSNILQIPPTPAESTQQDLLKKSILPDVYPPHFKYQLTPGAVLKRSLDAQVITPDDTITSELLESSSSSPSLPESLCELLQTKDIKDILNVEKVSYRLYDYHVQALALILNLRIEYLRKMLDKVMKIRPNVLKNIDNAVKMPFVPDCDLFAKSPVESWASSGDVVFNSQSPKQRRISTIGDRIRC